MALIECPECKKQVSSEALSCPNCGYAIGKKERDYDEVICSVKGVNGQLYLYGNRVVIARKGVMAKMSQGFLKGEKEIFLKQISGIQVKRGGILFNGYIQFTLAGGNEGTEGLLEAVHDENTVTFTRARNKDADIFKKKIYELKG